MVTYGSPKSHSLIVHIAKQIMIHLLVACVTAIAELEAMWSCSFVVIPYKAVRSVPLYMASLSKVDIDFY